MSYLGFGLYLGCMCAKEADVGKLDNPVWSKPIRHLCAEPVPVIQKPTKKATLTNVKFFEGQEFIMVLGD